MAKQYIVVCQQAWMNERGYGISYNWDGEKFKTRNKAKKHGFEIRDSDDFNIAVIDGKKLISFDWMDEPVGEGVETLKKIEDQLAL